MPDVRALNLELDRLKAINAKLRFSVGGCAREALRKFIDGAAQEGFTFNGIDAADLYETLFPVEYAALGEQECKPENRPS